MGIEDQFYMNKVFTIQRIQAKVISLIQYYANNYVYSRKVSPLIIFSIIFIKFSMLLFIHIELGDLFLFSLF